MVLIASWGKLGQSWEEGSIAFGYIGVYLILNLSNRKYNIQFVRRKGSNTNELPDQNVVEKQRLLQTLTFRRRKSAVITQGRLARRGQCQPLRTRVPSSKLVSQQRNRRVANIRSWRARAKSKETSGKTGDADLL